MASPNNAVLKATNSAYVVGLETALWVFDPHRMIANESGPSGPSRAIMKPLVDLISGDDPKSLSTKSNNHSLAGGSLIRMT